MVQWPKQRAWGWYATLIRAPWFCLKILRFRPMGKLSLQRHKYRTEMWLFINANGVVRHGGYRRYIHKLWGMIVIKPNKWHTFAAFSKPVYIIELQYGRKVTESDIERKL